MYDFSMDNKYNLLACVHVCKLTKIHFVFLSLFVLLSVIYVGDFV